MAIVVATAATDVSVSSAKLNGTVDPEGVGTYAWFEWGLTTSYGSSTSHVYVGDGSGAVDVSTVLTGLSPSHTYHYRVAAEAGVTPPPGTFGFDLPARLPESSGTTRNVATDGQLVTAWAASAPGDIVNCTADIDGGGASRSLSTSGNSGAPILLTCAAGVKIHNYHEFLISGNYIRVRGLEITGNGGFATTDGIKIDGGHVEIDECDIHDNIGSGIQIGSTASNWQIWNSWVYRNGSNTNKDHGIYAAKASGDCVIANCLVYDNWAYNLQLYSDVPNLIVTCCTVDGGEVHADSRGGVVVGDSPATHDVKIYGSIVTNAPTAAGYHYNGSTSVSNYVYDNVAYNNAGGNFGSGLTYVNCVAANPLYVNRGAGDFHLQAGSPAVDCVDVSRYGFVPETDIDGNPRVTADAGCYAA